MIENTCASCGCTFVKPHNPNRYKFCSIACSTSNKEKRARHSETMTGRNRKGETRSCAKCGADFYCARYRIERGEGKFCSKACHVEGNTYREGLAPPNKGLPMSADQRELLRLQMTGRKGPLCNAWRGGLTDANRLGRSSVEYRAWRQAVFERDGYACTRCGEGGLLHADHIQPWAESPELRYDVDNGRTLCRPCHYFVTFGREMPEGSRWAPRRDRAAA